MKQKNIVAITIAKLLRGFGQATLGDIADITKLTKEEILDEVLRNTKFLVRKNGAIVDVVLSDEQEEKVLTIVSRRTGMLGEIGTVYLKTDALTLTLDPKAVNRVDGKLVTDVNLDIVLEERGYVSCREAFLPDIWVETRRRTEWQSTTPWEDTTWEETTWATRS